MSSIKDSIIAALDRKVQFYDVAAWGVTVGLRAMSVADRDMYEASVARMDLNDPEQIANLSALLVAMSLVDKDGNNIFDHKSPDDLKMLRDKSAKLIKYFFSEILSMNALTESEMTEIKKH